MKNRYPTRSHPSCQRTLVLFPARRTARTPTSKLVRIISPIPVARSEVSVSPTADIIMIQVLTTARESYDKWLKSNALQSDRVEKCFDRRRLAYMIVSHATSRQSTVKGSALNIGLRLQSHSIFLPATKLWLEDHISEISTARAVK